MKITRKITKLWVLPLLLAIGITGCDNGDDTTSPNVDGYTVTSSSSPAAGGTTAGGGDYDADASVTMTATPSSGFTFTNWTGGGAVLATTVRRQTNSVHLI